MNWMQFPIIGLLSTIFWVVGGIFLIFGKEKNLYRNLGILFSTLGIAVFASFLISLWITLDRPPMRTLGETRLWYTFFIATIGFITYLRWRYLVFHWLCLFFALLFLFLNYIHPEVHDKALMPALQSPWFAPHVIVYILAYSLLGGSCLISLWGLYLLRQNKYEEKYLNLADNIVYMGFALLTLGLLFGALWAKEAWGHYWTWDPKETWAFLTWLAYLLYMHYRYYHPSRTKTHLWVLSLAFVVLLVCWFGINYLPSAQNSVHVYAQ